MASKLLEHMDLALVVREEKGLDSFYQNHPDRTIIQEHFARIAANNIESIRTIGVRKLHYVDMDGVGQ